MKTGDDRGIVRVGIAGLGRSGWDIHVRLIEPLKEKYRIIAVADSNAARRREAVERLGCRAYGSLSELFADREVELAVVATPSHMHAQNSIQALKAGKNVVCEKPMATTLADADRMIKTASGSRGILTVFQNRRHAPDFLKVCEIIGSEKLGRIVMVRMAGHGFSRRWDWQTLKEFGGGTLNNWGPHIIDQALVLLGEGEPDVFCHLDRALTCGDAEDHVKIVLRAPGAPLVDVEITSACAYPQEPWLVMGTLGGISGGSGELRWKYFNPMKLEKRTVSKEPVPDRSYQREEIPWVEEKWEIPKDPWPSYSGFYRDLHSALRDGRQPAITPESVRRQIAVMEKCRELCPL